MAQLTRNAILAAFMNLLDQRPFEKITVRDIVVECGITRNTFYYHFEDVYSVLRELLATETSRSRQSGDPQTLSDCFMDAMSFVLQHKRAAYHICSSSRKDELLRCLNADADRRLRSFVEAKAREIGASDEDICRIAAVYCRALIGTLSEWAQAGSRIDLEAEIMRIGQLLEGTVDMALGNSREQTEMQKKGR